MNIQEHIEKHSITYDPNYNLYSDNAQNIEDNIEINIDIGNIRFEVIYKNFSFGVHNIDQSRSIPHAHPYYEMHITKDGKAEMIFDDHPVSLEGADILIIPPNSYHYYLAHKELVINNTTSFRIQKNKNKNTPDYYSVFMEHLSGNPGFLLIKNNTRIIEYVSRLTEYSSLHTPLLTDFSKAFLKLVFMEILLSVCPELTVAERNRDLISELDLRMQTVQYYFTWHYDKNITLKQLAAAIKLSEKQTGRIIKKYFGVDFSTHLSNIRLKNSKKLLKETEREIRDISTAVGFKSYNGFYLAFKKQFGITPKEYRKKHKNKLNSNIS